MQQDKWTLLPSDPRVVVDDGGVRVCVASITSDARLIAAAPELLAALIKCSDRLSVHMAHSRNLAAQTQALKAIAKATGSDT